MYKGYVYKHKLTVRGREYRSAPHISPLILVSLYTQIV